MYGWELDGASVPVFQVSRHSDLVTDFIAVDHMCMFVTCSMDRRIVMWSASNRRVKAVWAVHKRGRTLLPPSFSLSPSFPPSLPCNLIHCHCNLTYLVVIIIIIIIIIIIVIIIIIIIIISAIDPPPPHTFLDQVCVVYRILKTFCCQVLLIAMPAPSIWPPRKSWR